MYVCENIRADPVDDGELEASVVQGSREKCAVLGGEVAGMVYRVVDGLQEALQVFQK